MCDVGALGNEGSGHTIQILKIQLKQVMEQIGCKSLEELPKFVVRF